MDFVTYQDFFGGRLKLRHLVVVLTVAEEGSTVAAADKLFVSQPAVTRLVRELEHVIGASLFERFPTGMRPTPAAEPFLEHARAALAHVKHAAQHVQELSSGESGIIDVGVHLAGSSMLLPRAIASLRNERPAIRVVVHDRSPDDLVTQLAVGEIDLLVTRLPLPCSGGGMAAEVLVEERLYTEAMVIVCAEGSPWVSRPAVTLADLETQPWVLPTHATALRTELSNAFAAVGLELPTGAVECTSPIITGALIARHGYLGIVPQTVLTTLAGLRPVDVVDCDLRGSVGFLRPADHPLSPATARLIEHLRSTATDLEITG